MKSGVLQAGACHDGCTRFDVLSSMESLAWIRLLVGECEAPLTGNILDESNDENRCFY